MKVLLIAINSKYIHSNLAIRYLRAFTKDLDYDCIIKEYTINDILDNILEEIIEEKPDIVGFSCYIWNITIVKKLSKLVKYINPNIEILVGGPEVSFKCEDILRENDFDYIIEREGEKTYREFIEANLKFNSRNNNIAYIETLKNINGLYSKKENNIYYGGKRELINMNEIVFPYEENDDLSNKIVYYEGSRGCPFGCKYCLSSIDRQVRFLDINRIKKEINFFVNKNVKILKFVDRTFNCNPEFAKKIWSHIVSLDNSVKTIFHFEICADILSYDEIEILKRAPKGRIQFEVGVQTTNNKVLRNINRYANFDSIEQKIKEIEKLKNIKQHIDLIVGLPEEDYESFKKSFNDVYLLEPEKIQIGLLKVLKGSPMSKETKKYGIIYNPYPPYNVLKTNHISYEEICKLNKIEKLVSKYYNSNKFQNILKFFEIKYNNMFDFFYDLSLFFSKHNYYSENLSFINYYKVFIDFNLEQFNGKDGDLLKNIIKFDYLRFAKKKYLPDFLKDNLDKKVRKNIMNKARDLSNYKNMQIGKFNFDILEFIKNRQIIKKDTILLFNCAIDNEYMDITKKIDLKTL